MRRIMRVAISAGLLVVAAAQDTPRQGSHWHLTDSESLWTARYSNCQYGYYFLLPTSVVAHAEHPPNPHHGFLVKLPDTSVTAEVTFDNSERLVWVNAEYNVTEKSRLNGVADYEIDITGRKKEHFNLTERRPTTLQGHSAIEFKAEYDSHKGRVTEQELIALRSGIVYELGLKTNTEHYAEDRRTYEQLLTGFRFMPIPKGECSNE
jgi:hypothetical protein